MFYKFNTHTIINLASCFTDTSRVNLMRITNTLLMSVLLVGCAAMQERDQQRMADDARAEAERLGNSGPLYEHYESCLNQSWEAALDSGADALGAYSIGVESCRYELSLLCDFYGVNTCYQDAEASNRLLFRLLREQYAGKLTF